MVRVVSLALMALGCLTVPVRAQPREEPADAPKGQRVFFASHSGMWYVPDPLGELAASANIKGHQKVGLQRLPASRTLQHWKLPEESVEQWQAYKPR